MKDDQSPKRIDCYVVEVENFDPAQQLGENGKKFRIEPQRLPYSLQWLHKRTPPVPTPMSSDDGCAFG